MNKGYLILAQNTIDIDYVLCAEALAKSIKHCMPDANVTLLSDNTSNCAAFDNIIKLPYGDLAPNSDWKLINDWQVYDASPYVYTIKLEADMYIPHSIEHWWEVLMHRDLVVSTTVRNFKQEISDSMHYRKFIENNNLPNCYNAITYFKKSETASYFFYLVKAIFECWDEFKKVLKCEVHEKATTDWVYALACELMGRNITTMPQFTAMSMVHMKAAINNLYTENWTDMLIYEILDHSFRINTCPQLYPVHYHIKSFAKTILESDVYA